ncbi:hypothetical protein UlMin_038424 [Ulmus minor]
MAEELNYSLEFTPTWIVAVVCFVIVFISLCAARALHKLGKFLAHEKQDALNEALQKLKEELMLLGFISLLLTVFQNIISKICIPMVLASSMLPCKREVSKNSHHLRRLLSSELSSEHCTEKGKAPLLSLEALHHLHIFIFVLAVVHVIFCVTTMILGGARIRQWKHWEDSIKRELTESHKAADGDDIRAHQEALVRKHADGYWRKAAVVSWLMAFFKQFYGSVTKTDYIALRQGFIKEHFPQVQDFDFHKYMFRTLEVDFKKIVGISWYLWLFVVIFLLLNLDGWHTYFWLAFLPLILLLLVGAKLEHIIARLALEVADKKKDQESQQQQQQHHQHRHHHPRLVLWRKKEEPETRVKPSDKHFWFGKPGLVLILIHFILFQNSFEIAFFFWIWSTYGFHSCIMEKVGYIIPRLFMGVLVQVLCSYSTLPLYAIVTQMGTRYKPGMFREESTIKKWYEDAKGKEEARGESTSSGAKGTQMKRMEIELSEIVHITEQAEIIQVDSEQPTVATRNHTINN